MELILIRRSQDGDEEAFGKLFNKYKGLVYKTAYLMLDNADEAENALQEIFFQVYKSLSTYDPSKGAFTTWLYRVTVNHCLNRRRKRYLSVISLDAVPPILLNGDTSSPENRTEEEETVQQVLGQLSKKLRTVVILRYFWELSYAEIAQILEVPMGTVKSRLNLALRTLRKELAAVTEDTPAPSIFRSKENT